MLVLTRKVGEAIAIGDDVKIIVMQIKGKQVRIGIKAGPQTIVHREEVYQKIFEENQAASQSQAPDLRNIPKVNTNQGVDPGSRVKWIRRAAEEPESDVGDDED